MGLDPIPGLESGLALEQDGHGIFAVVHRHQVERRSKKGVLGLELGPFVYEIVDELDATSQRGVMPRGIAVTVARLCEPGGLIDRGFDGGDVSFSEQIEDLLRSTCDRKRQDEAQNPGR